MRNSLLLAVLVAGAGATVNCGDDNDVSSRTAASPTPPGTRLVFIDQNILHGIINEDPAAEPFDRFPERLPLIAQALAEAQPDVVFLQEVVGNPGEGYPHVRQTLLDALGPEYTAVFGNFLGEAIDKEGLGQLTLTRLPIISSENRSVGDIRSVQHIAVESQAGPVDLYNAHLEGTGAVTEAGAAASVTEIENVIAFINETRTADAPVVLAGDFNAEPADPSIQRLLRNGFIDALAEAGDAACDSPGDAGCTNGTIPLGEAGNRADRRIDYIFVLPAEGASVTVAEAALFLNQSVEVGEGQVLWPSDHIGVRAVIEIGNGG